MKPRPPRAMIDTCPQSASLSAAQTARGWFGHRSVARGHRLGAGRTLVGHQPCDCVGGHTTWTCLACGGVVYAPPLTRISASIDSTQPWGGCESGVSWDLLSAAA